MSEIGDVKLILPEENLLAIFVNHEQAPQLYHTAMLRKARKLFGKIDYFLPQNYDVARHLTANGLAHPERLHLVVLPRFPIVLFSFNNEITGIVPVLNTTVQSINNLLPFIFKLNRSYFGSYNVQDILDFRLTINPLKLLTHELVYKDPAFFIAAAALTFETEVYKAKLMSINTSLRNDGHNH